MTLTRSSGILLHPSSLPGRYGIGEFGPGATEWLEFLAATGQSIWQMLPLNPVGPDGCPYQSQSTLAGNPLYISVDRLLDDGLIEQGDLAEVPELPAAVVNYEAAAAVKRALLRRAFRRFNPTPESLDFARREAWWLDDYASYMTLCARYGDDWTGWPLPYRWREPKAMRQLAESAAEQLDYYRFEQYLAASHFDLVRVRAQELGVRILGDVAMFPGTQSAEVWANPHLFQLTAGGGPAAVAGFPPDDFTRTGQVWGNALYRWDVLAEDGYSWWVARMRRMADLFDILRLDHFRGFHRYWSVPVPGQAADGHWEDGPGMDLFQAIRKELGEVVLVAEDLGPASADVQQLRVDAGMMGMRLLHFAFGGDENQHLPHYHPADCIAYTGTHDNNTTLGWWHAASADERQRVLRYLGGTADEICDALARATFASVAQVAILPLQDVLRLGPDSRLNTPGRAVGNWRWRYDPRALTPGVEFWLRQLTEVYGRDPAAPKRRARGFTG